jgi:L-threonylcarbamoyladenylate synthase
MLSVSDQDLRLAAGALSRGKLVAFPTETVYGLGGDAFNVSALAMIFQAKNRPRFDPLIIHIARDEDLGMAADLEALDKGTRKKAALLCRTFWPGPLSLILPKKPELPDLATSGLSTAAVRMPDHPAARKLIRYSTGALAAPSANLFGRLSPTRAEHVKEQLGDRVEFIIDGGGRCAVGVESTVLDLASSMPRIRRPGGCPREAIEALIGPVALGAEADQGEESAARLSPGLIKSHYAPRTPLVLMGREEFRAQPPRAGEGFLFFDALSREAWLQSAGTGAGDFPARTLSQGGGLVEAAANLFDILHEMDSLGLSRIRAEEAPGSGLGLAINDRLRRAAAR